MLPTDIETQPVMPLPATAEERCRLWYDAYGKAVYSYVRFHVSSADVAEDITADTFLKVFRAADRYDPGRGEARIWVFGIARNTLRDHLRRERVRRHTSLGAMRDLAYEAPSPEERLLWEEQVGRLLLAVTELNANDREIVGLRYGSELDNAAIAAVLGIGESGVRTRLWRALSRLRTIMDCQPQ
jgi:RNA polymerase sigma-70 factor (ECF subfamily)